MPHSRPCRISIGGGRRESGKPFIEVSLNGWYGRTEQRLHIASGTALWHYYPGTCVPIRWVLVRDPSGEKEPQAFLCTDLDPSLFLENGTGSVPSARRFSISRKS